MAHENKMFWRLHERIFSDRINLAVDILTGFGDDVQVVGQAHEPIASPVGSGPALALTTINDARANLSAMKKQGRAGRLPWLYFNDADYAVATWSAKLIGEVPLLNVGFLMPLGILSETDPAHLRCMVQNKRVFIRPNSGNKPFAGFCMPIKSTLKEDLAEHLRIFNLDPTTLCYISGAQDISKVEWRFWIVERKIVAYTPYDWSGDIPWLEAPQNVIDLATDVANLHWQPDIAFVVDIVTSLQDGSAHVCEINAASTSGVYDVDLHLLLSALRQAAFREHSGEISKGEQVESAIERKSRDETD